MDCLFSGMWVHLSLGDESDSSAAGMLQTKNDYWVSLGTKLEADSEPWLTRDINPSEFFIAYDFAKKHMGHKETRLFPDLFKNLLCQSCPWVSEDLAVFPIHFPEETKAEVCMLWQPQDITTASTCKERFHFAHKLAPTRLLRLRLKHILADCPATKIRAQANPLNNEMISSKHLSSSIFCPLFSRAAAKQMSTWMKNEQS